MGTLPSDFSFPVAWRGDGFITLKRDADGRSIVTAFNINR